MKLLVLGGAGYIGSHTATELLDSGHEVVVADSLVTGYKEAIPKKAVSHSHWGHTVGIYNSVVNCSPCYSIEKSTIFL